MKITIKKNIGKKQYVFEIDKPDFHDAYREAAKVDMLPSKCDVCGSENLHLEFRKPQGYNYPGIRCNDCFARAAIQGRKDGSEDFIKKMEKFQNNNTQNNTIQEAAQEVNGTIEEDIPF